MAARANDVESWVDEAVEEHHLTGLSVGVLLGDERIETSRGWANKDADIEARPDQVHQIGSVTKTYVTTMVNRLLVDGSLSLDDTLPEILPELRLHGDPAPDLSAIKVRHLLTHTSGLPGDAFLETGEGDESLPRWIEALATEPGSQLEAAPGQRWSYCNTAFGLLGRVIEHKTGLPFRRAMRELVTRPLGILTPVVTATEALRFRVAVGHAPRPDEDGEVRSARWAMLPVSSAPAGSTPSAKVGDVLTYARAHVDPTDERLGPRASLDALQEHHADQPAYLGRAGQGLGWMRELADPLVIGHGGSTQTQHTMLLASRDPSLVTVVCCNDLHGVVAVRQLSRRLWGELVEVDLFAEGQPVDLAPDADLAPLAGTYERFGNRFTVSTDDAQLAVRVESTTAGETATFDLERLVPLTTDGRTWRGFQALQDSPTTVAFEEWHDGRPAVLHSGGRANLRVSPNPTRDRPR
jgi:CubicO group peptidase (beta-lactamase class C family)